MEFSTYYYSFLAGGLQTPVVNEMEIQSIEEALNTRSSAIQVHLDTALAHLSNRKTPDYRNSIKESISAVGIDV